MSIQGEKDFSRYTYQVSLQNGIEVCLRTLSDTDGPRILDMWSKLSPQTIYYRYLRHLEALPESVLHELTHFNYETGFALAATVMEEGSEAIVGIARFSYEPDERLYDFAVAVRDDLQNQGLGKAMVGRLFDIGRERGITRFVTMIAPQNNAMRRTLQSLRYKVKYITRGGYFQVEVNT